MSEPYLGEIRMFGGTFAPRGWALCNGQLVSIAQNTALFSLLGTTYGGDGQTTFALPDLRGRVPIGMGQAPGREPVVEGETGGQSTVTLTINQLPAHTHVAQVSPSSVAVDVNIPIADIPATDSSPKGSILAQSQQPGRTPIPVNSYADPSAATGSLSDVTATATVEGGNVTVLTTGSNLPVSTMPPYIGINFIIALNGIFPSRN